MTERLRVLRHPAFRNLWLASSSSVMGDGIVVVALALFVTDLTGNATDVGIVLAAQMLPFVAFLLIGGVWADRLPRARVMITTDLVRMTLHTLLAILIFTDQVEIWHLVVIEALFGTSEGSSAPPRPGWCPAPSPSTRSRRRRRSRTSP
jgi:MFS family permease